MGILSMGASLDDVLALETEVVLSRRLQTLVYLKGFSSTPYQARQLISHGHVAVSGRKVTIPGYMVEKDKEGHIQYTIRSPLNEISHPARPKSDVYRTEQSIPLKETVVEKPVAAVPPKQEPAPALVAPVAQPTAVVAVPQQPAAEPPQVPAVEKPAEEKPVKHEGKPKEHTKKEKKAEGA
jgi:ribosomal protein S4